MSSTNCSAAAHSPVSPRRRHAAAATEATAALHKKLRLQSYGHRGTQIGQDRRMDERVSGLMAGGVSPYHRFTRDEWAKLRADTPLTLSLEDLRRLQSLHDPISLEEVIAIYLPLSRLLALYVAATQGLFKATQRFLGAADGKVPYIIGVAGSVAVGKSSTARVMQALLSRWPNTPKVELITTDGFLLPNAQLEKDDLMDRKGFPESYDTDKLIRFLSDVKAGRSHVEAPV